MAVQRAAGGAELDHGAGSHAVADAAALHHSGVVVFAPFPARDLLLAGSAIVAVVQLNLRVEINCNCNCTHAINCNCTNGREPAPCTVDSTRELGVGAHLAGGPAATLAQWRTRRTWPNRMGMPPRRRSTRCSVDSFWML